jgi:hypothetical protein
MAPPLLRLVLLPGVELETETAVFLPPVGPAPPGAFASPLAMMVEEELADDSFPLPPGAACTPFDPELPGLELPSFESRLSFRFPLALATFGCDRLWRGAGAAAGSALAMSWTEEG